MRIVQVCHKPPFPPSDGGTLAMHSLTQGLLDLGCDVRLISLASEKHPAPTSLPEVYREQIQPVYVTARTNPTATGALANLFDSKSYHLSRFDVPEMHRKLQHLLESFRPDLVVLDGLPATLYVPTVRQYSQAPCVYRAHNVETALWEKRVDTYAIPKRWVVQRANHLLKKYESQILRSVDAVVPLTASDEADLQQMGMDVPSQAIPFGIYQWPEPVPFEPSSNVLFLGSLDWEPNLEALEWVREQVWPHVHQEFREAQWHIAGRNAPTGWQHLQEPGIRMHGEVEDAAAFLRTGNIFLAPLFTGSGQRIKILEAMSAGKAIVTTSIAMQGIACSPGEHLLVADTAEDFQSALLTLLRNPSHARSLMEKARAFAEEHYHYKSVTEQFLTFIRSLRA